MNRFLIGCLFISQAVFGDAWIPVPQQAQEEEVIAWKMSGPVTRTDPDVAPDGERLAYVRHFTSIWLASLDGDGDELLVSIDDPLNVVAHPRWSPDGSKLLYSAGIGHWRDGGKTSVWLFRLESRTSVRILSDWQFGGFDQTSGAWSPDGERIAINALSTDGDDLEELLILNLRSGEVSAVAVPEGIVRSPVWSNDGEKILIEGAAHEAGNFWLVTANNTRAAIPVDSGGLEGQGGRFSPDGRWLSFHAEAPEGSNRIVYLMPAGGGRPLPVLEAPNIEHQSNGAWMADSKSLLVDARPTPSPLIKLAVIDTSGDDLQVLVRDEMHTWSRPAWSADEKHLAYVTGDTIRQVDLATGTSSVITTGSEPTWSPFGDEIAFAREGNIWSRHLETGVESQVTLNLENAGQPAWSPTGDQIAFRSDGLWLVSAFGGEPSQLAERAGAINWSGDGTRLWAHNNASNDYDGIWGDTWEYPVADAPNAGQVWGGSEGHVPYVAPDGSFVASFHWFQGCALILQQPHEKTGRVIYAGEGGLCPTLCTVSPSGTRLAFFLTPDWAGEIWKVDVTDKMDQFRP